MMERATEFSLLVFWGFGGIRKNVHFCKFFQDLFFMYVGLHVSPVSTSGVYAWCLNKRPEEGIGDPELA